MFILSIDSFQQPRTGTLILRVSEWVQIDKTKNHFKIKRDASEEQQCVVQFFLNPMGSLWMNYIHYYLYVYYKAKQTNNKTNINNSSSTHTHTQHTRVWGGQQPFAGMWTNKRGESYSYRRANAGMTNEIRRNT